MVGPQVIARLLASPDFEAFGSTRPRGQDSSSSQWQRRLGSKTELEFNPHDGVHQAIGGNMSIVELSARDPIFFLHHANIDRLWATWNRRGNANSSEAMWRDFIFDRNFASSDGSPWNVGVRDAGSPPALGYRYDDDNDPFAAGEPARTDSLLSEKLRAYRHLDGLSMLGSGGGVRRIELRNAGTIYVAGAENGAVASRDQPIGISVPLGRLLTDIVNPAAFTANASQPSVRADRRYVWAVVHDVELPLDKTTRVRIFCNCQELNARSGPNDPAYATSLSFFGGDHGHGNGESAPRTSSVCVDLTPALARFEPERLQIDRLTVQLLPECQNREAHASDVRPRRVEIVVI